MILNNYILLAIQSGLIFVATAIASWMMSLVLKRVSKQNFISWWLTIVLEQITLPLQVMIWSAGFTGLYYRLCQDYSWLQIISLAVAKQLIAVIPFFWAVFRMKSALEVEVYKRSDELGLDKTVISVISKLITVIFIGAAVVTGLHIAGMPLQSLLVFGGAISIAVGLASKTVIENFFGGLMVYINRPFQVGNWISSPDKNIEGVVEEIGWYSTKIRTFERRPMYVPNALFTNIIVLNPSRMYNRRIRTTVGLRYQDIDKVEPVIKDIERMLHNHPEIDQKLARMVHWVSFGDSSLNIDVYTFTVTTNWAEFRRVQQDVFLKIAQIVADHKAEIAFPTQTLEINNK